MRNTIKKIGTVLFFSLFSLSAFASDGELDTTDFFTFVKRILEKDIQPLLGMTTSIAYFIGLCLVITGMTRLYRHGSGTQNMMHRTSPMSTAMYFVSGIVLISFMPYIQMISNSIFSLGVQDTLMHHCTNSEGIGADGSFGTGSNTFCPLEAYSTHINTNADEDAIGEAIKYLMYGVLFLVGIISFIRGMVQLVKLGEGGQGQGVGRALTHIFAGIVAVNADSFYSLMQNIFESNVGS